MSKRKISNKKKKLISRVINVISIIVLTIFLLVLYKANILPIKYYKIIGISLVSLELIYTLLCINKKIKAKRLVPFNLTAILFIIIEIFAILKINETLHFLDINLNNSTKTEVYYFVVNKDSKYKELKDISKKDVYFYKDIKEVDTLKENIKKKVSVKIKNVDSMNELIEKLNEKEIILINSGSYESLLENYKEYNDTIRILDEVTLKIEIEVVDSKKDITKDPFIIYLSGIDTRSNYLPSRSLSDVNMLIVVNPKTRKILLVNTPRDYYVQIHGTEGLRDKLTHAGSMGGVELSKATIEDLYGITADYYARVNFNAVVNLVDAIGGITVNSDVDYTITAYTDGGCVFYPGDNEVGGRCALAFARERYAYEAGDRHRGENQQQVLTRIFNKLTSSTTLITSYSGILNALSGSFESSLSTDDITSLVQFQLGDMRGWDFEASNVDGSGSSQPTYSYPNENLYVMYPNEESVNRTKTRIQEVLEGK